MNQTTDISMNSSELYEEHVFTDRKIGTIRQLIPVNSEGQHDVARDTLYIGQTQMMSSMGPIPLTFEIDATNLSEACEQFSAAANMAAERTIEEAKELQRQSASQIVVPNGGIPGDGKIQVP